MAICAMISHARRMEENMASIPMDMVAPREHSASCTDLDHHRYGLLWPLICDLAIGHLPTRIGNLRCPHRQHAAPTTPLPLLLLPVPLLASVMSYGGLPAKFQLSLCRHDFYEQLWQSPFLWRALLQALGISEAALRDASPQEHGQPSANSLQALARRWHTSINLLTAMPTEVNFKLVDSCPTTLCSQERSSNGLDLEVATKAVWSLRQQDGEDLIQRAAESLASLLRGRYQGEKELAKAEALLEAVAARSDIFTIAQMLDVLGAYQEQALQKKQRCRGR